MPSQTKNIKEQVCRLEDLLRLYVNQEKEQAERHKEFSLEKISTIKRIQDQTLGGFGVVITILLGLTQLPFLKNGDSNSNSILYLLIALMVFLLILGVILFFLFNRWRQNTAWTLGDLFRSYDGAVENFEKILEYVIIATVKDYEGDESVVLEIMSAVNILKRSNELYQIKAHEKISKLIVLPEFRKEYHRKYAENLKTMATPIYEEYVKLNRNKIPFGVSKIVCGVFYDNEEYIKI